MTDTGWWIGYVSLILLSAILIAIFIIIDRKKRRQIQDNLDMVLISTFQEIACDYRVKVIKSGYGVVRRKRDRMYNIKEYSETCYDVEVDENTTIDNILDKTQFEIFEACSDSERVDYYIIFKVFGHHYLTYSENVVETWRTVVQKARKERLRIFGRSSAYDYLRR